MEKDDTNLKSNSKEIEREPNGQLKKGVILNPLGRPKGSEDFKTKWYKFIDKVAESENVSPEDIDRQLFEIGLKKAKEGDYAFYRDLHDRLYGKPTQPQDIKQTTEHIVIETSKATEIAEEYEKKLKENL